jgi:hypothetical protein
LLHVVEFTAKAHLRTAGRQLLHEEKMEFEIQHYLSTHFTQNRLICKGHLQKMVSGTGKRQTIERLGHLESDITVSVQDRFPEGKHHSRV